MSWSRDKSSDFRTLKDFQEQVLKELKSLKENQNKLSKIQDDLLAKVSDSKYIETGYVEEDWTKENVNIYFTNNTEEVNEMVIDCGAPKTLVGERHLHGIYET